MIRVSCTNCQWQGSFAELLHERDVRVLYCPKCTSIRWTYDMTKEPGDATSPTTYSDNHPSAGECPGCPDCL